jgi:glutathione S-transferase
MTRVAEAEASFDKVLSVYEEILANQKYLAGDEFTLADLFHLPNGAALKAGKWNEMFLKYPNVDKWFKGLQARDSWKKASSQAGTIP